MSNKYKLSAPVQQNGLVAYTLHEWVDGIFNCYRADPTATIHVRAWNLGGEAYIIADGVPVGVKAIDFQHALAFLKSILSITELEAA